MNISRLCAVRQSNKPVQFPNDPSRRNLLGLPNLSHSFPIKGEEKKLMKLISEV
jgi:hypothetical protein